jgi:hypothetical protein
MQEAESVPPQPCAAGTDRNHVRTVTQLLHINSFNQFVCSTENINPIKTLTLLN